MKNNNKKVDMILDNAEFYTTEPQELESFFEEREKDATWYSDETNCRADDIRFQPIFDEPICVPAEISKLKASKTVKFDASEEAFADTMYAPDFGYQGSAQMMFVGGRLYPVGISAIKGLTERAGMKVEGWDKLRRVNPKDLSDVLDKFMKATDGFLTVLVEDEKVRAVNSGRYAACPATTVLKAVNQWIENEYPDAKFVSAYANHDYAIWRINLESYTDDVLSAFPELKNNGFVPAMTVSLSHTGTSSVSFTPCLRVGDIYFPICEGINAPHIAKGKFSERMVAMESAVKSNLFSVFPKIAEVSKRIDNMRNINVSNAYNALLRGMKSLGLPKIQAMEAAEQFKNLYGYNATAYDIYMSVVDTLAYVTRDFPKDYRKQISVAKSMERAVVGIDWAKLGNIPGDFSW